MVASEAQRKKLAPVAAYFDRKHRVREDQDVMDKRFIASVQELMRAEERDQIDWTERRRQRLRRSAGSNKPTCAVAVRGRDSPKTMRLEERHPQQHQEQRTGEKLKAKASEALDSTQAMIRIRQLKSSLAKAHDPPAVAAELATLYLVLSDHSGALKSFQMAIKPSLEWVPTKEETEEREMQERRLMLMNKDRRAEALAALEAQDAERKREREVAEHARRRQAATGIYRCLLELKQPVQAAKAARARLGMCETREERQQVETEIHETLLEYDGLIEPAATNQGAWLTESAGALSDLHTAVLRSLVEFSMQEGKNPSSSCNTFSTGTQEEEAIPSGLGISCEGAAYVDQHKAVIPVLRAAKKTVGRRAVPAPGPSLQPPLKDYLHAINRKNTYDDRFPDTLVPETKCTVPKLSAFDDAIRGGPIEALLRERNKDRTPDFYLNTALEEESPKIILELDSRWQGGVEADEIRRRALADFARFTGLHQGAETLVCAVPASGWAEGGGTASEVAYAERLSRSRIQVDSRHQQYRAGAGDAKEATVAPASGLMLRHAVPAKDVTV